MGFCNENNQFKKMNIEPEKELILLLAQFRHDNMDRIRELLQNKIDWAKVLGNLSFNRMAGVAYPILSVFQHKQVSGKAKLCTKLLNNIQDIRVKNIKKHILDISDNLEESNISHAFLKGSILSNTLYPPGGRVSNDIDILLNQKDITKVGKILEGLGFQQGEYDPSKKKIVKLGRKEVIFRRMNWGEIVPYIKIIDEPGVDILEIDINFSLDWLPTGTEKAVSEFLENTEKYKIGNEGKIASLDKETFLIHLCMHLYKEAILIEMVQRVKDLDLYKFTDIYAYITEYEIDWEKFIAISEKNDLIKGCYFSLEYTKRFFPPLNSNKDFTVALEKLKPSDIGYLDEVIDPANPDVKYIWQEEVITRFFNMKRYEKLRKVKA